MTEKIILLKDIKPNPWNPNEMSDIAFQEYVKEIKHLGKPPKPLVLRKKEEGYEIVDGEHSYRALKELNYEDLQEGWFEIVTYDDIEAKRQTYKRNLGGVNNPVKLGLMFLTVIEESGMSNRQLAEKMDISDATIRAYLAYAEASKLRGDHANLSKLTNDQMKYFLNIHKISPSIANFWLYCGALEDALIWYSEESFKAVKVGTVDFFTVLKESLKDIIKQGMEKMLIYKIDVVPLNLSQAERTKYIQKFKNGIKKANKLAHLKERMINYFIWDEGITQERLHEYFETYFNNPVFLQSTDKYQVNKFLSIAVKKVDNKFKIVLTPEEIKKCIAEGYGKNYTIMLNKAKLLMAKKYGVPPSNLEKGYEGSLEDQLDSLEIEMNAPQYIKEAKWPINNTLKFVFIKIKFETEEIRKTRWEQIVKKFLNQEFRGIDRMDKEGYDKKIWEIIRAETKKEKGINENAAWVQMSEQELAKQFLENIKSFTNEKDIDSKINEQLPTILPRNYLILLVFLSTKYYEEQEAKERLNKLVEGFANVLKS